MQIGELTALSMVKEYKVNCPFAEVEVEGGPEAGDENPADDDKDDVEAAQRNDGGILGQNLSSGSKGKADGGPYPPDDYLIRSEPRDTKRDGSTPLIRLPEYRDAAEGDFPFVVGAHHLIPGNASLKKAKKLVKAMKQGGKITSNKGRQYTVSKHIGYDVNGAHNGVWLPGNYAIKTALPERKTSSGKTRAARKGTTPVAGESWSKLTQEHEHWQFCYVAGACKVAGGQFHDTHKDYSERVLSNLNKISVALSVHMDYCSICQEEGKTEIPPPYRIKRRLFALSGRLRRHVTGSAQQWKQPWFTSDRWKRKYFRGGRISKELRKAFSEARPSNPRVGLPE